MAKVEPTQEELQSLDTEYNAKEAEKIELRESIGDKRKVGLLVETVVVKLAKEILPEDPDVIELVRCHEEFMASTLSDSIDE